MAEAAGAQYHRVGARIQDHGGLLHRVIRGQPSVRQRCHVLRLHPRVEFDHRPGTRAQQLGEATVDVDARERAAHAVHVVASPAGAAEAAGDQRMHDDSIADGNILHRRPDRLYPTGALMPEGVRQRDVALATPLPLHNVQVGTA